MSDSDSESSIEYGVSPRKAPVWSDGMDIIDSDLFSLVRYTDLT